MYCKIEGWIHATEERPNTDPHRNGLKGTEEIQWRSLFMALERKDKTSTPTLHHTPKLFQNET